MSYFHLNDPVKISNTLEVTNSLTVNSLNATGSIQLNGTDVIDSSGNNNISGNLYVTGNTDIQGAATMQSSLDVQGTAQLNAVNVTGNADIDGTLNVEQGTIFQSTIQVAGTADLNGDLDVAGTAQLNAVNVTGNADIDGTLDVEGAANLQSTLAIAGNADLNGALDVAGTAQLNAVNVTGNADIDGALDVAGTAQLNILNVSNGASITNSNSANVLTLETTAANSASVLKLSSNKTSTGNSSRIYFANPNTNIAEVLIEETDINNNYANMHFLTRGADGRNERMTIDQDGNIGINNNNPSYKLDVDGDINFTGTLYQNDSEFSSGGGGAFSLNGTKAYYNDGNVGIGITNPSYPLDVVGDVNTSTDYNIGGTQVLSSTTLGSGVVNSSLTSVGTLSSLTTSGDITVQGGDLFLVDTNEKIASDGTNMSFHVGGQERMRLLSDGKVGVGTTTVGTHEFMKIQHNKDRGFCLNRPSGSQNYIQIHNSSSTGNNLVGLNNDSNMTLFAQNNLVFYTNNGQEKMRIKTDGNVGIGTNNPSYRLDVVGDVNTSTDYNIGGTQVLSSTTLGSGVVNSSLTSVGTLSSLDVSDDIDFFNSHVIYRNYKTTVNGTANQYYDLCTVNTTVTGFNCEIDMVGIGNSFIINKTYKFVVTWNATGNAWQVLLPLSTALQNTNDFEILIRSGGNSDKTSFRLRRISGTLSSRDVTVNFRIYTNENITVTDDTGSGTDSSSYSIYNTTQIVQRFQSTSSSYVGIGTYNPSYKLDVVGDINTSTDYNIGGTQVLSSTTLGSGIVNSSLTSVGTLSSLTTSSDITNGGDLLLNSNASEIQFNDTRTSLSTGNFTGRQIWNIGTGTTTLASISQRVEDGALLKGRIQLDVYEGIGGTLTGRTNFNNDGSLDLNQGGEFQISSNSVLSSTTLGSGVVNSSLTSVGTLSSLAVAGNTTISSTGAITLALTAGNTSNVNINMGDTNDVNTGLIQYQNSNNSMIFCTNGTNERMRINNIGNVGIGKTSPNYKLDIEGNMYISKTSSAEPIATFYGDGTDCSIRIDGRGGESYVEIANQLNTTSSWGIGLNDAQRLDFAWGNNSTMNKTTYMSILTSGNVGIGTNNPSKKLHVNGTFLVSGNDGFSGMVTSYVGEINGTFSATRKYSYGNGSSSQRGITMIKAGTVIGMSCSTNNSSYQIVTLYKNGSSTGTSITQGDYAAPPHGAGYVGAYSEHATKSYSFSAGDELMLVATTTALSPENAISCFWVRFD